VYKNTSALIPVINLHTVDTASDTVTSEPVLSFWARFTVSPSVQFAVLIYVPKPRLDCRTIVDGIMQT
jgi:hypothetical protein